MKRDFDLIREILLEIEGSTAKFDAQKIAINNYDDDLVMYNIELLINSGFINGKITPTKSGNAVHIGELNYEGHDLLDSIREKSFFDKVKKYTKDKGAPLTFETIKIAVPIVLKSLLE